MRNEPKRLGGVDEFDIFEILGMVWRRKFIVLLAVLIVTGVASVYAFLAPRAYEIKAVVQPPFGSDVAPLNYGRGGDSGLAAIDANRVFNVFLATLQSEALRREFYRTTYLPAIGGEGGVGGAI